MPASFPLFEFDNSDIGLFFAAEQISRDYLDFLKVAILPRIAEKYDIRIRELLALICIGSAIRPISSSELATLMRQDPATMTRSNVVLIGQGYIRTTKSFGDSRVKILNITEKGQKLFDLYEQLLEDTLAEISNHYLVGRYNLDISERANEFIIPLRERAKSLASLSLVLGLEAR